MTKIEKGRDNIYEDLSVENAEDMLVKAKLVTKIREILKTKNLKQQEAAKILEIPQPKLSKMLRGQFRGISEVKMLECLTRLGRDVKIVIGPDLRYHHLGHISVELSP